MAGLEPVPQTHRTFVILLGRGRLDGPSKALAGRQSPWQTDVSLTIDPKTISFTQAGGRHQASLDVAIFLGGRNERQVGELRRRVDLNLEPSSYARMMRDGVAFNAKVDATAPVRYVKAVIHDFGADRLGSAVSQLR